MKTLCFFASLLLCGVSLKAQIYVDPATAGATAVHSGIINGQLNRTNDNLTLIQRGQLAVTGQLVIVNDLQNQIYKGLSEVSAVVRNLLAVKDITEISADIVQDVNKAMNIAGSNPVLLLFAESGAREFKTRATNLAVEVSAFVLQGGKNNLMDSGERAKLLNRIVTELTILRGVAYGMYRSMYWAKQRGILNSLNPYAGFINIDKRIADDIIRNAKYLKE
ncbi:hypothetical protein [Pedobacter hiemivivus]|uniref:Plasmid transfer protein n=1 Tax=Pedobacter hiemivivus TaxID=2530454 RepID=A0A4R0N9S0_9SPHI|nr:hypothetical protein [Pedobacter hiemivivus]TCC94994.1 hypothetical protein EZ444_15920 [Pedobacter hiemivivus]